MTDMILPTIQPLTLPMWLSQATFERYEKYKQYMQFIFRRLGHTNFAIAGGAIRDLFLDREPKDIDVFVFSPMDPWVFNDLPPGLVEASFDGVVVVREYDGRTFQFISSPCDDINHLLRTFDWQECMYAMDAEGQVWTCNQSGVTIDLGPSLHLNPNLTMINNPTKTLFRSVRFNDRLKIAPTRTDIHTLCQLILKEGV